VGGVTDTSMRMMTQSVVVATVAKRRGCPLADFYSAYRSPVARALWMRPHAIGDEVKDPQL
jgi:hypothetical protein